MHNNANELICICNLTPHIKKIFNIIMGLESHNYFYKSYNSTLNFKSLKNPNFQTSPPPITIPDSLNLLVAILILIQDSPGLFDLFLVTFMETSRKIYESNKLKPLIPIFSRTFILSPKTTKYLAN